MNRWNPNLLRKIGDKHGHNPEYLDKLVDVGASIQSQGVPVIYSLAHLANLSRTLYSDAHAFVARSLPADNTRPYRSFTIKKRSGGKRWISVPAAPLKAIQSWINREILNKIPPHPAACAYVSGLKAPLKSHAERHCGSQWILKIDIKDFFSNISERQVYYLFRALNYPKLLSFEMARLCTRITPRRRGRRWRTSWSEYNVGEYFSPYVGSLPQGAPSSPALSNLVCRPMDERLSELSQGRGAEYSRYADDLCFSFTSSSRDKVLQFKKEVSRVLWRNAFTENKKKVHIVPPGARKLITGLLVNEDRPTLPREIRDRIRMHLYHCKEHGIPSHCANRGFRSVIGFRNHLFGLIEYAASIDAAKGDQYAKQFRELPWLEFEI